MAMKGFVPTCLTRWFSSFALALHAAEEQGNNNNRAGRGSLWEQKSTESRVGEEMFWNVTPSRGGSHRAGWSHSVQRWFEVGVRKASTGVEGVSATIRQHGKGSATCVCSQCGGAGKFQGCKAGGVVGYQVQTYSAGGIGK